ncbi:nucleoside diphosphate kinase regulator [Noviherbaspirillum saxi]|uniref:Nucleoside diphosphate kinase regulator n=1 Tax=Noviherbaspirillum saxi TaxID=2320863 RepID=A0A3A3G0B8_9BURK|nr:nucleoside diphosphate kinase regulator [Noviherbaspirillum saxi]RJF92769.1 nucleoside diphosphate kinase regulator [Noviherbaspirillum saxi]
MKPSITVSLHDLERLELLLDTLPSTAGESKRALLDELTRAHIVESTDIPSSVVAMHSKVRFDIAATREEFCLTLVYPKETHTAPDTISVLTPIGTALLGMSVGSSIEWPRRDGQMLTLKVLEIISRSEREEENKR